MEETKHETAELTPSEQLALGIIQPMLDCDFCVTCPDDAKAVMEGFAAEVDSLRSQLTSTAKQRDSALVEVERLNQAVGWILDAADAAYIDNPNNKYIHDIFNIAAKVAGLTRRLPDEHGTFEL